MRRGITMNLSKAWMKIRDSFWFVPTLYSIASLLLVVVFHITDELILSNSNDKIPEIFIINEEIAREIYSSLVTAILTMTTISFSVIMVVLTTYSSQFSPRTLQDFMQNKVTHHILGVFCFGFIFALVNLVLMGKHDTIIGPILMIIISIVCLAFFIYFIHHAAKWLRVSSLISNIHSDSTKVIKDTFAQKEFGEHEFWNQVEIDQVRQQRKVRLLATEAGYIQKIEWKSLLEWAKEKDAVIELHEKIGDYMTKDLPLLTVYRLDESEEMKKINEFIVIGVERTDVEDIEFIIQKLVEIAVKAVSPSINDPDTAINCINRIGSMLSDLGKVYKEIQFLTDERSDLRIIKQVKRYEYYLYRSFYQILYYGKKDVSVCYSLIEVLYKIALANDGSIRRKLWAFHYYVMDAIDWDSLLEFDRNHLESIYQKFKSVYITK